MMLLNHGVCASSHADLSLCVPLLLSRDALLGLVQRVLVCHSKPDALLELGSDGAI
jgi:hypothetical protein